MVVPNSLPPILFILFILSDDNSRPYLGAYGATWMSTPNLDQFAREGMLFERACELLPEQLEQGNAALTRAIYLELGQEAMRESAEWVSTYRQRPIQPPK